MKPGRERHSDGERTSTEPETIGENDFRVPLNNTLEYWSALQRMILRPIQASASRWRTIGSRAAPFAFNASGSD
jgi:hypothetical protein